MLANKTESRNFSAVSAVDIKDGTGQPVMYMNASYNGKDLNFSNSIQDISVYKENKEEVDADYNAFQEEVISKIG